MKRRTTKTTAKVKWAEGGGGKREEEESREDLHAASRREDRIAREWSRRTGRKGAVHRGESVERARKRRDEREGPRE